jgi:phosphatidylserine/phosphatidylglycerophosphate/cardiolipin synthase-like enzyme
MSSEKYLRTEKVHIDEVSCKAKSTIQWFAEDKNKKGEATHPITHNNKLSLLICGQEGFAAIAKDIAEAKESIDLVCWGFDPGMELLRNEYKWTWPRSETYGDLLIAAGRRGVRVRLLVWYSWVGGKKQKHMPGHTHDTSPWRTQQGDVEAQKLNGKASLQLIREHARENRHKKEWNVSGDKLAAMAREEYCCSWYKAAFAGRLQGISIRLRDGDCDKNEASLGRELTKPDLLENYLMEHHGTHHQKPILIDFAYNKGEKAVGYVMGLNSLTGYWDTEEHAVENPLREQGAAKTLKEHTEGVDGFHDFETQKPYRDYACRIDGGRALIPLHENFENAWERAGGGAKTKPYVCSTPPSALLRKGASGDSTVQIVRTQPEEDDFTIRDIYFNATRVAAGGTGYLYLENQYFQYQEWAEHLLAIRKKVIAGWNRNCAKIGKGAEDLPVMHVFVVIPAPETKEMIPRTYETLAPLGQQGGMTGQVKMIDQSNEKARLQQAASKQSFGDAVDRRASAPQALPEVVSAANKIAKPSMLILEKTFGLRVCVAVLNACEFNQARRQWRYREIYIHSKLLLVDDGFFTLGSANLNQRSMAVDSEINLATNDPRHATALRKRIWSQLATEENNGGNATPQEIAKTFKDWVALMNENKDKQKSPSTNSRKKQMKGFIVPLDDGRSSTARVA